MNVTNFIKRSVVAFGLLVTLLVPALGSTANAMVPYDPNGTPTTKTPVFNQFTGVPNGIGDESDFVRIKNQAGGNADYVDTLNSACDTGSAYTVRTYVHNGADPSYNEGGAGSAVAHDVVVKMTAPLGSTSNNFEFGTTVSANNAASVSDKAYLNCNQTTKLVLVPGSVKTYSKALGWQSAPDSAVNGTLKIGSQAQGSGDVWACWDDRVIVTYDVKVEVKPQPKPSMGECKVTDVTPLGGRKIGAKVTEKNVENAQVVGYKIDWGDGSAPSTKQEDTHEYAKDGKYIITGYVQIKFANGDVKYVTAADCAKEVTFKPDTPVTPVTPPTGGPTVIPNTGPGDVAAIFAAVSVAAGVAYRFYISRRFNA